MRTHMIPEIYLRSMLSESIVVDVDPWVWGFKVTLDIVRNSCKIEESITIEIAYCNTSSGILRHLPLSKFPVF